MNWLLHTVPWVNATKTRKEDSSFLSKNVPNAGFSISSGETPLAGSHYCCTRFCCWWVFSISLKSGWTHLNRLIFQSDVSEAVASVPTLPLEFGSGNSFGFSRRGFDPCSFSVSQQWCNQISDPSISVLLSQHRRAASALEESEHQTGACINDSCRQKKQWESRGAGQILQDIRAPACRQTAVICWRKEQQIWLQWRCREMRSSVLMFLHPLAKCLWNHFWLIF